MKKRTLPALLLVGLMALTLAACGGSSGGGGAADAPDYLGTYPLCSVVMGPLLATPEDFGFESAYIELKDNGKCVFNDGSDTETIPYTIDGTAFSLEESDSVLKGTIENGGIILNVTAADMGGEGDEPAIALQFAKGGSDAETSMQSALDAAGTIDEQMESMELDDLMQILNDFSFLFE